MDEGDGKESTGCIDPSAESTHNNMQQDQQDQQDQQEIVEGLEFLLPPATAPVGKETPPAQHAHEQADDDGETIHTRSDGHGPLSSIEEPLPLFLRPGATEADFARADTAHGAMRLVGHVSEAIKELAGSHHALIAQLNPAGVKVLAMTLEEMIRESLIPPRDVRSGCNRQQGEHEEEAPGQERKRPKRA